MTALVVVGATVVAVVVVVDGVTLDGGAGIVVGGATVEEGTSAAGTAVVAASTASGTGLVGGGTSVAAGCTDTVDTFSLHPTKATTTTTNAPRRLSIRLPSSPEGTRKLTLQATTPPPMSRTPGKPDTRPKL